MKKRPKPQKPKAPAPIAPKQLRDRYLSLASGSREDWLKQIGDLPPGTLLKSAPIDSIQCQDCGHWVDSEDSSDPFLLYRTLETDEEFQARLQLHQKVEEEYQKNLADYHKRLKRWKEWRTRNAGAIAAAEAAKREKQIAALEAEAHQQKAALERVQARLNKALTADEGSADE